MTSLASLPRRLAATAIAAGILAAGCGGAEPPVSDDATTELQVRTAQIRELAEAGRPEEALVALTDLQALVADLRARGEVTSEGADDILDRATEVTAQLQAVTTTTTTTTTTTAPPRRGDEDEGGGNGGGGGRGHGRDRDRDD